MSPEIVADGLAAAPEAVFRSVAEAGYRLHYGNLDIVGAVFLRVVGALVVRAVRGPLVMGVEAAALGPERFLQVGVLPPAPERHDDEVHEGGLTQVPVGVVGGVPLVVEPVPVALELHIVGVEGHVYDLAEALARHRVPRIPGVGAEVDVRCRVEELDYVAVQPLEAVGRVLLPEFLHLRGVVGRVGPEHLHEREGTYPFLVVVGDYAVVREEFQHLGRIVAGNFGELLFVRAFLAGEVSVYFRVVYRPDKGCSWPARTGRRPPP